MPKISNQQIADLMVTALEGGSNYWIDRVEPRYTCHHDYSEPQNYGPDMVERALFAEDDDTPYLLNDEAIQNGLRLMPTLCPHHWADVVNDNVDADTADVFLQLCVFGELVYG